MIINFKLFEKRINNKYNIDDIVIVNNNQLNNRMVAISEIHISYDEITYTVWNATKNMDDEHFLISEKDIVKKMPSYKEGTLILLKDYDTGKPKPMIILNHMELGLFEMIDLQAKNEDEEYVEEPYYNIIRKMNKKDLEKYKDIIERYEVKKETDKYNL